MWQELLSLLGAFAVASGILAWLIRTLVGQLLDKELESYKAGLASSLEAYKSAMEREAFEHRTKFSHLFERRGEVIDELYRRLVDVNEAFYELSVGPGFDPSKEGEDPELKRARTEAKDLVDFYARNKLYLDKDLISAMEELNSKLHQAYVTFMLDRRGTPERLPQHEVDRRIAAWDGAFRTVQDEVPALRRQIETLMRRQLGIDERDSAE